jgi:hypothetical protein
MLTLTHLTELVRGSWRFAAGLRGFLSRTIDLDEAKGILSDQLQSRESTFLLVLERGIFGNPHSPYRRLLEHAGYTFEDVRSLVTEQGLDRALSQLYKDGVYVTLDEFKGRASVRRHGLEFPVTAFDFDNPLLTAHYQGSTGGSRGDPTRVHIDFDLLALDAANILWSHHVKGVADRPCILWQSESIGLRNVFMQAHMGQSPMMWFSPSRLRRNRQGFQSRAVIASTILVGRLCGRAIPWPKFMPDARGIVGDLAKLVEKGTPGLVLCGPSDWVKLCTAAEAAGANIAGTTFRGGGEPYTEGKAAVLERVGANAMPAYAMHEVGSIGLSCGTPSGPDDLHILKTKVVVLQHPKELESGSTVQAFFHTTLLTSAPKLMLNVESGDYGVVEERDCGCPWQDVGFTTHIHTVRSYEKLTSGSVMFMGSMLHELLEETLPKRFGGSPLDYQLVEEEEEGVPRVSIVVSPRNGPLDEEAVVEAVLQHLGFADWSRRQAQLWRQSGTLRVQRREPFATGAGKILPLHVLQPRSVEAGSEPHG